MARVLILGGGFGGLAVAHRLLEKSIPDLEIILIDQRETFIVGFRKTWSLLGLSDLEDWSGSLVKLKEKGIRYVSGKIDAIDPSRKSVNVDGDTLTGDYIVVALGADLAPEIIPGFQTYAHNVYERDSITMASQALQKFKGGKVLVGIFGTPYKCPPAPYEIALLVNEQLKSRSVPASVDVFTPLPMSLPILGSAGCSVIEGRLASRGIGFWANRSAKAVGPGEVFFNDSSHLDFDLLLGVAPHRVPDAVKQSGLTGEGDWVTVNPETLVTQFDGIYAVGDVTQLIMTNGKPLPKAGVFAQSQGEVVADHIAAALRGERSESKFTGEGGCFLEVGNNEAVMVEGHFLSRPEPQVSLTEASSAYLESKRLFELERLKTWFSR